MSGLDSRFICTSDIDTYYVDKDSGLPLSGGIVTFYSDVNRSVLKPVYQLTGAPGAYTYAVLPNPITLSDVGTFQDGLGNNIVPYYYPFIGTPAENTGDQELYYITVVSSGFVPQLTRQGWPQAAADQSSSNDSNTLENFIPNGQFLAHNNEVAENATGVQPYVQYTFGSETVNAQPIAQGGWYFVYTNGTTAVFDNSFSMIPSSGGWGTNNFPRYSFNFSCTSFNANAQTRDLRIQWPDVNKFSAGYKTAVQPYTLYFDAVSNDSNSYTFTVYQIYYFGTGGSPSAPITNQIATITITPSSQNFNIQIPNGFPANQGTLGTNNDDYVAISIRGPFAAWNVELSDFALLSGLQTLTSFPTLTNAEMLSGGVAGFMPTPSPTGNDIGLPLILTAQGLTFDHGVVGEVVGRFSTTAAPNEVLMDGTAYLFSAYNSYGIPYSRIGNFLIANSPVSNTPLWGTGANFATAAVDTSSAFYLIMNTSGGLTAPTSSSAAITIAGSDPTYTLTVASVPASSAYFTFVTNPSSPISYYVWFNTGSSTNPAPGGTGIMVSITGSDTTATVTTKIIMAVNSYQFVIFNAKGYFLRGVGGVDPNASTRTIAAIGFTGSSVGTIQSFLTSATGLTFSGSLVYSVTEGPITGGLYKTSGGSSTGYTPTLTPTTGGMDNFTSNGSIGSSASETRPLNLATNWFIKI